MIIPVDIIPGNNVVTDLFFFTLEGRATGCNPIGVVGGNDVVA